MSNEVTIVNGQTQISPWGAFANETQASAIAGDIFKFAKGEWYRGEEKKSVPPGTKFLCNMAELWTGWVRWFDSRPVEHRIARLIDFPPKLLREDLGHTDKSLWETDPSGNPKDPWSPTDRLVMRDVEGELLV
jgi:hypothetical protein